MMKKFFKLFIAFLLCISNMALGQHKSAKLLPSEQIPEGYVLFEKLEADLNKDGQKDSILIIKGTDPEAIYHDEYRGELDRNRRGLMVFFQKDGGWELTANNIDLFAS